jgi:hypothetical protein
MEEQMSRMMLHGAGANSAYGGRMTGAGATPSMGLSQFRGGEMPCPPKKGGRRRKARSPSPPSEVEFDDEDMDLEGGFFGAFTAAARAVAARAAAAARTAAARAENARRAALGRATQVRPSTGTAPRPAPKPVAPAPKPVAPTAPKPVAPTAPKTTAPSAPRTGDKVIGSTKGFKAPVGSTRAKIATGVGRLGTIANVAVPAYMLADYLRQQQEQEDLDLGYFDDYAGEGTPEEVEEGAVMDEGGEGEGGMPDEFDTQVDTGITDTGLPMGDKDAIAASYGLTRKEYDIYVRSGNLPVRRGRGQLTIQHEGGAMRKGRVQPRGRPALDRPVMRPPPAPVRRVRLPALPVAHPPRQSVRAPDVMPMLTASGRKSRATGRRSARAEIVKKVMRERGVKLGEASRIVKEEGLF